MNKAEYTLREFYEMDELADRRSPVHRFSALSKLAVTVVYLFVVVSFDRYDLTGVLAMALYPYLLFAMSGLTFGMCIRKMRYILPLLIFAGIFNPFLDRNVWFVIGSVSVSKGWLSLAVLIVKAVCTVSAVFLLIGTTKIDAICGALRRIHVPSMLVTLILLTYRYMSVLTEEVAVMTDAYHLRAPRQKGIDVSAWGSFLGQLILRSMDRARELYASMLLRGYTGEFPAEKQKGDSRSLIHALVWCSVFLLLRFVPVIRIIGTLITGGKV